MTCTCIYKPTAYYILHRIVYLLIQVQEIKKRQQNWMTQRNAAQQSSSGGKHFVPSFETNSLACHCWSCLQKLSIHPTTVLFLNHFLCRFCEACRYKCSQGCCQFRIQRMDGQQRKKKWDRSCMYKFVFDSTTVVWKLDQIWKNCNMFSIRHLHILAHLQVPSPQRGSESNSAESFHEKPMSPESFDDAADRIADRVKNSLQIARYSTGAR